MTGLDQAFIDAYRTHPLPSCGADSTSDVPSRSVSPGRSDSGNQLWYRVDQGERGVPAGKGNLLSSSRKAPATIPYAFEVTTWDAGSGLSAETAFVAANVVSWTSSPAPEAPTVQPPASTAPQPAPAAQQKPAVTGTQTPAPVSPAVAEPDCLPRRAGGRIGGPSCR